MLKLSEELKRWSWRIGPPGKEVKKMIDVAKTMEAVLKVAEEYSEHIAEILPELSEPLAYWLDIVDNLEEDEDE